MPLWLTTDLAGNVRTVNGSIDIGAYECSAAPANFRWTATTANATITDLTEGMVYDFRLQAINVGGLSDWTEFTELQVKFRKDNFAQITNDSRNFGRFW